MTPAQQPNADTQSIAFDLEFLRACAMDCHLTEDELTALTGLPTADWDTHLTPHTLNVAALISLARALNTSPESLLRQSGQAPRPNPQAPTHASILHAALLETGCIHPDDLASALEWSPLRLNRAAAALAAHLQHTLSPQRLIHTDTTIHLTTLPGLLTPSQRRNLHSAGHTSASLTPTEAAAITTLLHHTAHGLPHAVPPEQIPRLANQHLLASTGPPTPHPDLLFALGRLPHPPDGSAPAPTSQRPAEPLL